jgi:hypothetical protein
LVSHKIEKKILDYIAGRRGLATENDVVRYIVGELSKPPTLKLIDNLESEGKINIQRGRKGQPHYLSINDKNRFNQIKQQISSLENFIKEINQYLQRRNEENKKETEKDFESTQVDKGKAFEMDNRISFVDGLYYQYYDAFKRILDDLFQVTTMSDISKDDSEIFLKEIIELKSKLKYRPWTEDNEKNLFKVHISKINNLIRKFERSGLEDYIEEKQIKSKFAQPLISKINDFIAEFLD